MDVHPHAFRHRRVYQDPGAGCPKTHGLGPRAWVAQFQHGPNLVVSRSTASEPAIARRRAAGSKRSTSAGSAPKVRTRAVFSLPRAEDRTRWPASTRARRLARPKTPVPPATKTLIDLLPPLASEKETATQHRLRALR